MMDTRTASVPRAVAAYGHFDTQQREYVIREPLTPLPWINYLGTRALYSIVSNTGGGYSFYRDAKLRRLTRYRYDSVPLDNTGKYLYIADGDCTWNPGFRPTQTPLDAYECRHGLGYTRFRSARDGLHADVLVFVSDEDDAEFQVVTLRNGSGRPKSIRLFSFVEWCQWNAEDDSGNLQRNLSLAECLVDDGLICHITGYRERRRHYGFHVVNRSVEGFDTDRDTFLGRYGELRDPAVVRARRSANSIVHGWWPIASFCVAVTLQPGESDTLVFASGFAENAEHEKWRPDGAPNVASARRLRESLRDPQVVETAFVRHRQRWQTVLDALQVSTPDAQLNELVNTWNPYQCMVTFNLARSASLFETGRGRGIGFRDSNQDCLGMVHIEPDAVRERLLHLAATQKSDGSAYHQYQPLTRTGNSAIGGGFNDDPLWLVLGVTAYLRETARLDLLDEEVSFEDAPERRATLRDHVEASLHYTLDRLGVHGLPLIGRADWNDCLNLNAHSTDPDESFQTGPMRSSGRAESVMIAALFVLAAREFAVIADRIGNAGSAAMYRDAASAMVTAIERHGWDGDWFLRAYDDAGQPVGSHVHSEGQIFLESQALCAMAGVGAERGLVDRALQSVAERLATPYGVQLLHPPYRTYHAELGEVSTYLPGYKENGSVFCHTNPWVIIAEAMRGRSDRAIDYLRAVAPTYQLDLDTRRTEPYVYAQMVAGEAAAQPGEAKNSWLTGTASWSNVAVTQYILGLRASLDGLVVDPCIPSDWPSFTATRRFRGATYRIEVVNPRGVGRGVTRLQVDGQTVAGNLVAPAADGATVLVQVELG
jgi:cellobiose phosphorylase